MSSSETSTQPHRQCDTAKVMTFLVEKWYIQTDIEYARLQHCILILRRQKISYAKTRSHTISKLTGTFHEEQTKPTAATSGSGAAPPSSFPAPPGSTNAPPTGLPAPPGLPQKPNGKLPAVEAAKGGAQNAPSPAGQKRQREESDDEGSDAPMDEDSGGEMEMSDSD